MFLYSPVLHNRPNATTTLYEVPNMSQKSNKVVFLGTVPFPEHQFSILQHHD